MRELLKPHYVWRPLQAARRIGHALRRFPAGPLIVTLPWRLRMRIDPAEEIGQSIWQLGLYDLVVSEALWRLISPGDLVVDAGANIGAMTGLMALRAAPSGEVFAFEPQPQVFRDLADNVARYRRQARLASIRALPVALSDTVGTATLHSGERFALNHGLASLCPAAGEVTQVATTTLDEALDGRTATVVKIDVERGERQVLEGAREALAARRIRHIIYEAYAPESDALLEMMRRAGYTVFALGRRFLGPLLSRAEEAPCLPPYEAPSFLASCAPAIAISRLLPRGWQVLLPRRSHPR